MDALTKAEIDADIAQVVGPTGGDSMRVGSDPFDGASMTDRWVGPWMPTMGSADSDILPDKMLLDMRSRDIGRNDGLVQSGNIVAQDSIIGAMYMLNAKPDIAVLGLDEKWEEEMQEEVESKFLLAAESPKCWFDAARSKTLTGILRLATGIWSYAGETLHTVEWIRDNKRPFKTAINTVDLDRLSNPFGMFGQVSLDGRIVRGGVHQDTFGAAIGYYIRDAHPADLDRFGDTMDWTYVLKEKPWGRDQVIHIKDEKRAGQTRAVADIVAGLKEVKITKKFRDVTLQQAVLAAMYAMTMESDLPPDVAYQMMGGGAAQMTPGAFTAKYGLEYLNAVKAYAGRRGLMIDDVKVPLFFPGTRLNTKQVGAPGGVGQEFEQSLLRYVAAILGISYEELSKDFSKTNYSSAKAAFNQTWKRMSARKKQHTDRLATIIYMLWFEEMMNNGRLEFMKYSKAPNFYDGLNKEAYCACDWIGAARGQIDELKETQAAVQRIGAGLSTYEDELARMGKDWRKVFRQLEREQAEAKLRKLTLQLASNAQNAASGSPRDSSGQDNSGDNNAEAA